MDADKLIMLCERNELNFLHLLEWEEEFDQTVEDFRLTYERKRKKRKGPREWAFKRTGAFWEKVVPECSAEDFKEHFRMEKEHFQIFVERLQCMRKHDTSFRKAIPIDKRIGIALYTLGCRKEFTKIGEVFGVSATMVGKILNEFCLEIKRVFAKDFLPQEFLSQKQLEKSVKCFQKRGFPQCFGVIGSCHIYTSSRVLFALVDSRCRFQYLSYNSEEAVETYEESSLMEIIDSTPLFKSNSKLISGVEVPIYLLGNSAFRLSTTVMTPYDKPDSPQEKLYNNILSENRKVFLEALQQLKSRFGRISKELDNLSKPYDIIVCCCILHNILNGQKSSIPEYWLPKIESEGIKDEAFENFDKDCDKEAKNIREVLTTYLSKARAQI